MNRKDTQGKCCRSDVHHTYEYWKNMTEAKDWT
jgi:hypothetical protein